jgi:glutamate-1-semialdehyde 2,1-aminomutase
MTDDRITERARRIAEDESARLLERTQESARLFARAAKVMPLGVASSFQAGDPYPIYLREGKGSSVWDVDGNEYVDFHGGFGTMVVGHAHPKVVEAVERAARTGTHFAVTTETTIALAEELCRRFDLEQVRFANSGTEATMEAIRLARAATGRDVILKIEGSYHGHHDAVMFSVVPNADVIGGRDAPASTPLSRGIPADTARHTAVVAFNDADALGRLLDQRGDEIACLIMEPIMMNVGIVTPQPGYLERVKELCARRGVVLIFDEVKSGATVAYGGAGERFGVRPDLACFAKAAWPTWGRSTETPCLRRRGWRP